MQASITPVPWRAGRSHTVIDGQSAACAVDVRICAARDSGMILHSGTLTRSPRNKCCYDSSVLQKKPGQVICSWRGFVFGIFLASETTPSALHLSNEAIFTILSRTAV